MLIGTGKELVTAGVSSVTGDVDEDVQQIERELIGIDNRVKLVYIDPEL